MSTGALVFARLIAAGGVTALVGASPSRIYPGLMPQAAATPACVYSVVSEQNQNSLAGWTSGLKNSRFQLDCYARTYAEADTLAAAVAAVLDSVATKTFSSLQVSRRDLYEDDTELHRVSLEFSIWSQP